MTSPACSPSLRWTARPRASPSTATSPSASCGSSRTSSKTSPGSTRSRLPWPGRRGARAPCCPRARGSPAAQGRVGLEHVEGPRGRLRRRLRAISRAAARDDAGAPLLPHGHRVDSPSIPDVAPPLPDGVAIVVARDETRRIVHAHRHARFADHWGRADYPYEDWWGFWGRCPPTPRTGGCSPSTGFRRNLHPRRAAPTQRGLRRRPWRPQGFPRPWARAAPAASGVRALPRPRAPARSSTSTPPTRPGPSPSTRRSACAPVTVMEAYEHDARLSPPPGRWPGNRCDRTRGSVRLTT